MEMEGDKALGLDGFTMAFFHKCWSVVEKDVMDFFDYFHRHSMFERSLNASFLTLIPKSVMQFPLRTFTPSVWWVVCISCYPRCWLIG